MMRNRFKHLSPNRGKGFTLIEILLAIFIFALIVTTLFSTLRSVLGATAGMDTTLYYQEAAMICMRRMTQDLTAMYVTQPLKYTKPDSREAADPYRLKGDLMPLHADSFPNLRFTSKEHLPLGNTMKGIAEIHYYVQPEKMETFVLRRSDHLFPYPEFQENPRDPVVCEHIKTLKLTYYDHQGEVHDTWDSESADFNYATPRAIGIELVLGRGERIYRFQTLLSLPVFRKPLDG